MFLQVLAGCRLFKTKGGRAIFKTEGGPCFESTMKLALRDPIDPHSVYHTVCVIFLMLYDVQNSAVQQEHSCGSCVLSTATLLLLFAGSFCRSWADIGFFKPGRLPFRIPRQFKDILVTRPWHFAFATRPLVLLRVQAQAGLTCLTASHGGESRTHVDGTVLLFVLSSGARRGYLFRGTGRFLSERIIGNSMR